jgi:hypothetical protein
VPASGGPSLSIVKDNQPTVQQEVYGLFLLYCAVHFLMHEAAELDLD